MKMVESALSAIVENSSVYAAQTHIAKQRDASGRARHALFLGLPSGYLIGNQVHFLGCLFDGRGEPMDDPAFALDPGRRRLNVVKLDVKRLAVNGSSGEIKLLVRAQRIQVAKMTAHGAWIELCRRRGSGNRRAQAGCDRETD